MGRHRRPRVVPVGPWTLVVPVVPPVDASGVRVAPGSHVTLYATSGAGGAGTGRGPVGKGLGESSGTGRPSPSSSFSPRSGGVTEGRKVGLRRRECHVTGDG